MGLQIPGLVDQLSPAEQLPFPEDPQFPTYTTRRLESVSPGVTPAPHPLSGPGNTQPLPASADSPGATRLLLHNASPAVTRLLPDIQTGSLPASTRTSSTTALRQPVVIPSTGKKSTGTIRAPKGRKWVVNVAVLSILLVLTFLTGHAVIPADGGNGHSIAFFPFFNGLMKNNGANLNPSLVAQAATATAIVRQDGYYSGSTNNGSFTTGGDVSADRFAFGQCTYWADLRYHALTGHWVNWIGNAYQWPSGARAAGWIVSSTPHVPSIIALQPGVQGAGYYGHVGVVERINSDGSVYTSNYNWYANGGFGILSYWTFSPGSGVLFIWFPGK